MTSKKPSALTPDLLTRKAPPVAKPADPLQGVSPEAMEAIEAMLKEKLRNQTKSDTRSLTVKVDGERYRKLGRARLELSMSGQDILIEALDGWFKRNKF